MVIVDIEILLKFLSTSVLFFNDLLLSCYSDRLRRGIVFEKTKYDLNNNTLIMRRGEKVTGFWILFFVSHICFPLAVLCCELPEENKCYTRGEISGEQVFILLQNNLLISFHHKRPRSHIFDSLRNTIKVNSRPHSTLHVNLIRSHIFR